MALKWIKYLVIGFATLAMMISCCHCKELTNTTDRYIKDSINVKTEIRWRDTIAWSPSDIARIMGMVKCPENGKVNLPEIKQKSKQATVKVSIKDNKILASCECDSIEQKLKLYEKEITNYKANWQSKNAIKTIEIEKIPKWAIYLLWAGVISILAWIIKLVLKIYKKLI